MDSRELIEVHSSDDKEGFISMACKPSDNLAMKESVRVRHWSRKSKAPDPLDQ